MQEPERDEKNQNKCPRCGRIVGCDEMGKTRECDCIDGKRPLYVKMELVLDVEQQDSTIDAIEAAKNQLRLMDTADVINMLDCEVID